MRKFLLPLACASIGLTVLAAPPTKAADVSVIFNFSNTVSPVGADYALFFSKVGTAQTFEGFAPLAPIPADGGTQSVVVSPAADSTTTPASLNDTTPIDAALIMGVYNEATAEAAAVHVDDVTPTPGLALGVSQTVALGLVGQDYSTLQSIYPGLPNETTLVGALESLTGTDLQHVLNYIGTPAGVGEANALVATGGTGELVDFSTGTANGTFTFNVPASSTGNPTPPTVPLPAAAYSGAGALGLLALIAKARKKLGTTI